MGSEVSTEEENGYENGDVKKNDDFREDGDDESEKDKENNPPQDAGVKQQNGDLRKRKTGKVTNRSKAEMKRAILKTKPPIKKEQENPVGPKWLSAAVISVEKTLPRWLRRLFIILVIVALAFGTRFFNVSEPSHIWLVKTFSSVVKIIPLIELMMLFRSVMVSVCVW